MSRSDVLSGWSRDAAAGNQCGSSLVMICEIEDREERKGDGEVAQLRSEEIRVSFAMAPSIKKGLSGPFERVAFCLFASRNLNSRPLFSFITSVELG